MGLAPYGEPTYADLIREHLIDVREDGSLPAGHGATSGSSQACR